MRPEDAMGFGTSVPVLPGNGAVRGSENMPQDGFARLFAAQVTVQPAQKSAQPIKVSTSEPAALSQEIEIANSLGLEGESLAVQLSLPGASGSDLLDAKVHLAGELRQLEVHTTTGLMATQDQVGDSNQATVEATLHSTADGLVQILNDFDRQTGANARQVFHNNVQQLAEQPADSAVPLEVEVLADGVFAAVFELIGLDRPILHDGATSSQTLMLSGQPGLQATLEAPRGSTADGPERVSKVFDQQTGANARQVIQIGASQLVGPLPDTAALLAAEIVVGDASAPGIEKTGPDGPISRSDVMPVQPLILSGQPGLQATVEAPPDLTADKPVRVLKKIDQQTGAIARQVIQIGAPQLVGPRPDTAVLLAAEIVVGDASVPGTERAGPGGPISRGDAMPVQPLRLPGPPSPAGAPGFPSGEIEISLAGVEPSLLKPPKTSGLISGPVIPSLHQGPVQPPVPANLQTQAVDPAPVDFSPGAGQAEVGEFPIIATSTVGVAPIMAGPRIGSRPAADNPLDQPIELKRKPGAETPSSAVAVTKAPAGVDARVRAVLENAANALEPVLSDAQTKQVSSAEAMVKSQGGQVAFEPIASNSPPLSVAPPTEQLRLSDLQATLKDAVVRAIPQMTNSPINARFSNLIAAQIKDASFSENRTRIELAPKGLGGIEIEMIKDETGRLQIVVRAENVVVLEALRNDRDTLAALLSDNGVSTESGDLEFEEFGDRREADNAEKFDADADEQTDESESDHDNHQPMISGEQLDILT